MGAESPVTVKLNWVHVVGNPVVVRFWLMVRTGVKLLNVVLAPEVLNINLSRSGKTVLPPKMDALAKKEKVSPLLNTLSGAKSQLESVAAALDVDAPKSELMNDEAVPLGAVRFPLEGTNALAFPCHQ